jgi:sterol desaturase/sphingolipid hydroxylase (fatty acid hydroxylase superfamily)
MAKGRGAGWGWLFAAAAGAALGALVWGERRRPLRRSVEPGPRRVARNLALGALGAAVLQVADRPVTRPLAALVGRRGWGLLGRGRLPRWAEVGLAFLLLDYTLWIWHVLLHRWPPLWRFHAVHHADLDLDASTGLRFHAGELLASVPWRAAQVALIGAGPVPVRVWQCALFLSVLFHHSNLRLPLALERALALVLVTPRQHGIHHSIRREESDSNWSSLLNVWDRLHGTLRLDVPQDEITIGLPALRRPEEVSLEKMVALPFERRSTWL